MARKHKEKAMPISPISTGEVDILRNFASNMKFFRERLNWKQSDLAAAANIDRATISRIETNERVPSLKTILNIAEALGVSIDDLYGYTPVHLINEKFSINTYGDIIHCFMNLSRKVNITINEIKQGENMKIPNELVITVTDKELAEYYYSLQEIRKLRAANNSIIPKEFTDDWQEKLYDRLSRLEATEPVYEIDNPLTNAWYTSEEAESNGESTGIQE